MKIGVFVPIGNNGWLISTHAPQYMPTFELNKAIVQKAEHYHFDFALSMIKLRGFGGKTEFWDHTDSLNHMFDSLLELRQEELIARERTHGLSNEERLELWTLNQELAKK